MNFSAFIYLFVLLLITFVAIILPIFLPHWIESNKYKKSSYYNLTKTPYMALKKDLGKYGEYLISEELKLFEETGSKLLFNLYIPKKDGETTEIDLLMIHQKGIFIFESKNYNGFIFGDENQKNWTQTLKSRSLVHKNSFYNPIMQNESHIKHLKTLLDKSIPTKSIIVFSNKSVLKHIPVTNQDVRVINCFSIKDTIANFIIKMPFALSENEIQATYNKLLPYTQVNNAIKAKHIEDIKKKNEYPPFPQAKNESTYTTENPLNNFTTGASPTPLPPYSQPAKTTTPLCPQCNRPLVLKTAKSGAHKGEKFYGCPNYPSCKYMKNL